MSVEREAQGVAPVPQYVASTAAARFCPNAAAGPHPLAFHLRPHHVRLAPGRSRCATMADAHCYRNEARDLATSPCPQPPAVKVCARVSGTRVSGTLYSIPRRLTPIAECLGDMDPAHSLAARQIGDRPPHPKHAVKAAGREPHRLGGLGHELAAGLVRGRDRFEQVPVGLGIGPHIMAFVAPSLDVPRRLDPSRNLGRALARRRQYQVGCQPQKLAGPQGASGEFPTES